MVKFPSDLPDTRDAGRMGPKMQALTKRQRAFVQAMLDTGMTNHTRCAMMAGYTGTDGTLRVAGHRLAHDERIQSAIQEEAKKRMQSGVIMAVGVLQNIAETPGHKDQLKAAMAIMDRSGLHAVSENKTVHEVSFDEKGAIARIRALCLETGQDPRLVLGAYGYVDAEFEEVKALPETPKIITGYEGLEDML